MTRRDPARKPVNGILQLHRQLVGRLDASTVSEHVGSLQRHSEFRCWNVNTELGFPSTLRRFEFSIVVLHYSIFGAGQYGLDEDFRRFLREDCRDSYKVAMFQDEYHFCHDRFDFLNEFEIDCVFSCLEERYLDRVYGTRTGVQTLVSSLPGYVSEDLPGLAARFSRPRSDRPIDIGYRGRALPPYLGRGGQEKLEIGVRFLKRAEGRGLRLDISCSEGDRIYGNDWYRFIGSCKSMLGTESGVSLFDLDDEIYTEYLRLRESGAEVTLEQLEQGALGRLEGEIEYRTIGPRHFEAAALRTCQVLYEGHYSGAMEPMVHYIPLKKDFSNFEEALDRFADEELRRELADNAYDRLIDSGDYSYASFVAGLDRVCREAGLSPEIEPGIDRAVSSSLHQRRLFARTYAHHLLYHRDFAGRGALQSLARPFVKGARKLRGRNAA